MPIDTLIFIVILCSMESITVKLTIKLLQKKGKIITQKTYNLIRKGASLLAFIIMIIYINNTVIRKNQNKIIERGEECCIYMNGEIKDNKCILEDKKELKLKELGSTKSEQYKKYCKKYEIYK